MLIIIKYYQDNDLWRGGMHLMQLNVNNSIIKTVTCQLLDI